MMERYVFASDIGHWSVYCEKVNDVAVLAVDDAISRFARSRLAKLLGAVAIGDAPLRGKGRLFDFQKLVPEWKSMLTSEYGVSGRPV